METVAQIEARRKQVVREMCSIRSMRRGSVSEQYVPVRRKGKKTGRLRGPYYVFSRWAGQRSVSERLRSAEEVERARQDVAAHKRFVMLCREFEELTERLGRLERQEAAEVEVVKKGLKSRSSRAGK